MEAHLVVCASTPMAPSHLGNHAQGVHSEDSLADVFPIEVASRYSEFLSPEDYRVGLYHTSTQQSEFADLLCR